MKTEIGIDARMIQHSGIGTYLRGLLDGMAAEDPSLKNRFGLFGPLEALKRYPEWSWSLFDAPIYSVREQLQYPKHVGSCELWHAPHYNVPIMKRGAKLVVTIHDIIHWLFRKEILNPVQTWYAKSMMQRAVSSSDHIITVSNNTKEDLVEHFSADPKKVTTIYEAINSKEVCEQPRGLSQFFKSQHGINDDYFLYVGLLKPHKNVHNLVRLFEELKKRNGLKEQLVLVGKKDKSYRHGYEGLASAGSQEGVVHIDYVDGQSLQSLYSNARALIHPSLYEGFGLTLLEAMSHGTPVLACKAGSIPEVVGDAALLVEPDQDLQMANAIQELSSNSALREGLAKKGKAKAQEYSWQRAAQETLAVYERVLGSS